MEVLRSGLTGAREYLIKSQFAIRIANRSTLLSAGRVSRPVDGRFS